MSNARSSERVVIVGSGQGGFQVAASLREAGHVGSVTLIGDEGGLPYQRPPLSKDFLSGRIGGEQISLRPMGFYKTHEIDLVSGKVERINRRQKTVTLSDGSEICYDHLVIATGARNRCLAFEPRNHPLVHHLRSLEDATRLRVGLATAGRIVLIGGGFIGLEVAAAAAAAGTSATIVHSGDRLLSRSVSDYTSAYFHTLHTAVGNEVLLGRRAVGLTTNRDSESIRVRLDDGSLIDADRVVIGVGVEADVELAELAGLATNDGILVDHQLLLTPTENRARNAN